MNHILTGTWWTYAGPGDGQGVRHMVVGVAGGEVTTWSESLPAGSGVGGFTWHGP
jgi:hypothetical protein